MSKYKGGKGNPAQDGIDAARRERSGCPECERSYGPHYKGVCEHGSAEKPRKLIRVRVNGRIISVDCALARQAAREALAQEPSAYVAEVLGKNKEVLARFTRAEAGVLTVNPIVDGFDVSFDDRYQRITLHCINAQHAAQVARAIASGVRKFSSKAE